MGWFEEYFINEAKSVLGRGNGTGGVVDEEAIHRVVEEYLTENPPITDGVQQIVDEYLTENPPVARVTINGMEPDENGNFTIDSLQEGADNMVEI